MEENYQIPVPAVDEIANGSGLQMFKACIPYLPAPMQKSLILYIKMLEMNNLLSYYNSGLSACSSDSCRKDPEELLNELHQYGTEAQNQMLDQALNLISTLKMYRTCQDLF